MTDSQRPGGLPGVMAAGPVRRLVDGPLSAGEAKLIVPAGVYARLVSLADQAPLEGLPIAERTLACAKTMGYNLVGQVRCTTANRLVADVGAEHADELLRALHAFGLRQQDSGSRCTDLAE